MRYGIFIIGLLGITLLLSGCTTPDAGIRASPTTSPTAIPTPTTGSPTAPAPVITSTPADHSPQFTIQRTGDTSVVVHMTGMGGATSVWGFHVTRPYITSYIVIPANVPLSVSETIEINDPNLTGTVHFVANSSVNGHEQVVLDTMI